DVQANTGQSFIPSSLQSVKALPKLVAYLKECCPPVLMSATHYINEIALLAKRLALVPTRIVVTEHTFLSQEVKLTEQVSSRLVPLTVKALYGLADEVIAVSHGVAQDLESFMLNHRKPIQVIYNSVVTPAMYDQAQQPIDHPWFHTKDQPVVIGGGRFVRQKDFATLLRAFAQLRDRQPAHLVLLGDGREREALQQLAIALGIEADVWFPGFVDNPYPFLAQADVFALSSAWEGLPTVLIEALALGVAIVSTDCPSGPAEILRQGEYGHLVPVGDAPALATAMAAVLAGDRRPAPRAWVQQFTPAVVIQKYIDATGLQVPPAIAPQPTSIPERMAGLVSVVIPAYNAADLIGEALATVQQQTYPHWEVIVVEDGTQDGTEAIVQRFAQGVGGDRVRYVRHEVNQGLSATRNTGISHASGEYIALLDHDDTWQPQHLEQLVAMLKQRSVDVAFAAANFFDYCTHAPLGFHGPQPSEWADFPNSLMNRNYIPASGVVMRHHVPHQVGGFDPTLKRVEDLDYWLRCAEAGLSFAYLPEVTNGYRQRNPRAMTSNKADILEWHARVLRKHFQLTAVSRTVLNRVLARYHLGVARRSLKSNPSKAYEFLYWSFRISPIGSLAALRWFLSEKLGQEERYA
ncbi:MAG TPA: glycosyltransferase, partial [Candidatus Obscuribacterales bacterium]